MRNLKGTSDYAFFGTYAIICIKKDEMILTVVGLDEK